MFEPDFWKDKFNSKNIVKEKKIYEDLIGSFDRSNNKLRELVELNQLALEEENFDIQKEVLQNIKNLEKLVKKK